MTKTIICSSYVLLIIAMATATLLEKNNALLGATIYRSPLFLLAWAVLASASALLLYKKSRRPKSLTFYLLHLSLLLILAGALLTHLTSQRGRVHLRIGEETRTYLTENKDGEWQKKPLPYALRLDTFQVICHEGTSAPADYASELTVIDEGKETHARISMNNILNYRSMRYYQSSYDEDEQGSILTLYRDPYGIAVTYTGYALLFISLIGMLLDPRGSYRRLLRHPLLHKGMLALATAFVLAVPGEVSAQKVLPQSTADKLCRLQVVYNDRVCPLQTFAIDFTKKLCGSRSYGSLTATQVLTGCIFWGEEWSRTPFIKLSSTLLQSRLGWPDHVAPQSFFKQNPTSGISESYALAPYLQEYYHGINDRFHRDIVKTDEKIMLLIELRRGTPLKIFPHTTDGHTMWYAPTDKLPETMSENEQLFVQRIFTLLYQEAAAGKYAEMERLIDKIERYQQRNAGNSIPSPARIRAEHIYNALPWATLLFIANLTLGLLTLGFTLARLLRPHTTRRNTHTATPLMALTFLLLTALLGLRWTVSGYIPLANGYETMLVIAWFVQLVALIACQRFPIMLTFGFLLSGFFLLVSHISLMDPQITHRMPVLNSPLLSLHVSVIMMAYALLSVTFVCALTAQIVRLLQNDRIRRAQQLEALRLLSQLFLYPAMTALGIGIFVGAIWANVSWGQYWSWDPKETWALITFMVYAIALHTPLIPRLKQATTYHTFILIAFLTLLMTYFGVNYLLSGMHSYA